MPIFEVREFGPRSQEKTKLLIYFKRVSFLPPKKTVDPNPPLQTGDINKNLKRLLKKGGANDKIGFIR